VSDVVSAFVGHEKSQSESHQLAHVVEGARTSGAKERLQFGEGQFDWIEIGTVWRKKPQTRSRVLNRLTNLGLFVSGEIVEDHDVAAAQGGHENLLDVSAERRAIDGAIEHGGGRHLARAQRRDDRVCLPMAARCVIGNPGSSQTPPIATQQIGGYARLVDEDVLPRLVKRLRGDPAPSLGGDIRTTLFVGVYGFF
jgi:hypothetical protein